MPILRPLALVLATLCGLPGPANTPVPATATLESPLPGRALWSIQASGGFPPFVLGEEALFIRKEEAVLRLGLADGAEAWSVPAEGVPVREDGGLLFLVNDKFELSCLDALTGKLAWKTAMVKEGSASFGRGVLVVQGALKGPVVAGDKVLVGTFGGSLFKGRTGKLYAYDRRSGKLLWSFEAEDGLEHAPLIHQGRAIFGGVAACYAVDLATGEQVWKASTRSDNQWFFKIAGDTLLMSSGHYGAQKSSFGGTLYAFDVATGAKRWQYDIGGPSVLQVADGKVLGIEWGFLGGTRLTCLDLATGKPAWEFKEKSSSWPVVLDGKAMYLSKDNRIHLVDLATGKAVSVPASGDFRMGFFKGPWGRFLDPQALHGRGVVGSWDKGKKETILQILDVRAGRVVQEQRVPGEVYRLWERQGLLGMLVEAGNDFTLQVLGR